MGQEIANSRFSEKDFRHYRKMLEDESALLKQWFDEERFVCPQLVAGCELEAWLIDERGAPAPVNVECLNMLTEDEASPELSQFNIELNFPAANLSGNALSDLQCEIEQGARYVRQYLGGAGHCGGIRAPGIH